MSGGAGPVRRVSSEASEHAAGGSVAAAGQHPIEPGIAQQHVPARAGERLLAVRGGGEQVDEDAGQVGEGGGAPVALPPVSRK